jgi:hypothetical protein
MRKQKLVGGYNPSENISQLALLFPIYIYRKIKNINQQPEKGPVVFCRLSNGLNLR